MTSSNHNANIFPDGFEEILKDLIKAGGYYDEEATNAEERNGLVGILLATVTSAFRYGQDHPHAERPVAEVGYLIAHTWAELRDHDYLRNTGERQAWQQFTNTDPKNVYHIVGSLPTDDDDGSVAFEIPIKSRGEHDPLVYLVQSVMTVALHSLLDQGIKDPHGLLARATEFVLSGEMAAEPALDISDESLRKFIEHPE